MHKDKVKPGNDQVLFISKYLATYTYRGIMKIDTGGHGMTIHITNKDFETQIAEGLTFIDFWAEWCGPCRMLGPVIDELSTEFEGKIKVAKVNIDENPEIAQEFGIMSIPTMILFENGKPVEQIQGFQPKKALQEYLESKV